MYVRKCPECLDGKMLATSMKRGWGKEYKYVCNTCGYQRWIYEGGSNSENSRKIFWLLLLVIEIIFFINDDFVTFLGYVIYGVIAIFFLYRIIKPFENEGRYEILEEIDLITPEEMEEELSLNYSLKDNRVMFFIAVIILGFVLTAYFDNWYLLTISLLSFIAMYYYGFLDISSHRRDKFYNDKEFEKSINDIVVKIDSTGKPIYPS